MKKAEKQLYQMQLMLFGRVGIYLRTKEISYLRVWNLFVFIFFPLSYSTHSHHDFRLSFAISNVVLRMEMQLVAKMWKEITGMAMTSSNLLR
jgi:hypothetical protein